MKSKLGYLIEINQAKLDKDYEKAAHLGKELLLEYGNDPQVMQGIALSYYHLGFSNEEKLFKLIEQALDWMDQAIKLNPENEELYTTRAEILSFIPEYEKAAADCRKALEINPVSIVAGARLASLERPPGDFVTIKEAVVVMERIARAHNNNPHVLYNLGLIYDRAGRKEEAREQFERALNCREPLSHLHLQSITNFTSTD